MALSTELSTRQSTEMKDTPEPLTNNQVFLIIIALLVVGWGIAVLVDTPLFQRLMQFLSMGEGSDGETVGRAVVALARHC